MFDQCWTRMCLIVSTCGSGRPAKPATNLSCVLLWGALIAGAMIGRPSINGPRARPLSNFSLPQPRPFHPVASPSYCGLAQCHLPCRPEGTFFDSMVATICSTLLLRAARMPGPASRWTSLCRPGKILVLANLRVWKAG